VMSVPRISSFSYTTRSQELYSAEASSSSSSSSKSGLSVETNRVRAPRSIGMYQKNVKNKKKRASPAVRGNKQSTRTE